MAHWNIQACRGHWQAVLLCTSGGWYLVVLIQVSSLVTLVVKQPSGMVYLVYTSATVHGVATLLKGHRDTMGAGGTETIGHQSVH